jgi:hypothetical protein
MGMKLPIIDDLAWLVFRLIGAIQAMMFTIIGMIKNSNKLGDKVDLISRVYSGWYIFGAKDRNSVPKIIRDRGLLVGRLILAIALVGIMQQVLKVVTR